MKLTNYIRDAFIASVMNDVPEKDYHEEAKAIFTKAWLDTLPLEIQMAWVLPKCKEYVNKSYHTLMDTSFEIPANTGRHSSHQTPPKVKDKIDALVAKYIEQKQGRVSLRIKIKGAAYACTTTKQLRELLPEFDRYLPAEEEKTLRTLPVVQNIVADFVRAGWPKKLVKG